MTEMGENSQSLELERYIETGKRNISSEVIETGGIVINEKPTPDYIAGVIKRKGISSEIPFFFHSEEPNPSLKKGFNLARDYTNILRSGLGLSKVKPEKMPILLVKEDSFNEDYKKLTSLSEVDSAGFCADLFQPVVVKRQSDIPNYIIASHAFHELIHKYLETNVRTYSFEKRPDSNDYRVFAETRRSGLNVKRHEDGINKPGELGDLLNELPNYLLQNVFLNDVFTEDKFKKAFSGEIERRNIQVNSFMGKKSKYALVTFRGREVAMHRSVIHFDNGGDLLLKKQATLFVAMQLASDLYNICDDIDGKPFWITFLQAKVDPKLQGKLKDEIDSKLGKGFYRKLKLTKYQPEEMLDLLVDVQSHLYTFRKSADKSK